MIEKQREKQIKALGEHGKQLVKSGSEKESLRILKQKYSSILQKFWKIANERINEIQDFSKQTELDKLTYYFKNEIPAPPHLPPKIINVKGPLDFYKNIKHGYKTVENF